MHDILKEILSRRIMEIERVKAELTQTEKENLFEKAKLKKRSVRLSFKNALIQTRSERAVIAEFKRASPSKGDINTNLDPANQAFLYEKCGAAAISILTEPDYFKGSMDDIKKARGATTLPILCKDFIVDPIQINQAKLSGADAVLLIVAALSETRLRELYAHARILGLDVLVESHNQIEIMRALKLKDAIIGINNRNLKTFITDLHVTKRLTALIPKGRIVVSESGIKTVEDMTMLGSAGAGAFLVGETLMRLDGSNDKAEDKMKEFVGCSSHPKVKICGLTRPSDIRVVNGVLPDYAGFVFAPSKRQVDIKTAKKLIDQMNPVIKSVGVFVNTPPNDVMRIAIHCGLDVIQLHGSESVSEYKVQRPVWKSISVKDDEGVKDLELKRFEAEQSGIVSGLVYDTYHPEMAGGSGESFSWGEALPRGQALVVAAGGMTVSRIGNCVNQLKPDVIDVSSGVETDGYKDPGKIREFVKKIRMSGRNKQC